MEMVMRRRMTSSLYRIRVVQRAGSLAGINYLEGHEQGFIFSDSSS